MDHGGSKEKEKQLWNAVVFQELVFSIGLPNEHDQASFQIYLTIYSDKSFKSLKPY